MTFPAGGGPSAPAGAGGNSQPPSTTSSSAPDQPTDAASGAEDQSKAQQQPDAGTSAAPPQPKVEARPASLKEAIDRARAAASGGEQETAEDDKPPTPKQDARPDAGKPAPKTPEPPKPDEKKQPAPQKETAPPAGDSAEPRTPPQQQPAPQKKEQTAKASESDESADIEDDDSLIEAASKGDRKPFEERFPDADKGKKGTLDFAYRQARKIAELKPIAEMVERYGGVEGAKLPFEYADALVALSRPAASAEDAFKQAESFREFLWKNAPGAAAKVESAVFWNAVQQDTPEGRANIQALLDERYGEGVVTTEVSDILHNAYADGRIDVDALRDEGVDYTKTKAQREAEARQSKRESAEMQKLRDEIAELKGGKEETEEAKAEAKKEKVATAFKSFVGDNFRLISPILREYGFAYPDDQNSPEFKSMARRIRHVQRDLEEVMEQDEDYRAVVGNIANLQTESGVHAIQLAAARNKMRVKLREILDEVAPEAAAEIKRKNRLVADRVKQNGNRTTTATPAKPQSAAPPRDASNSERAIDGEQRRQGMARMIEQGRRDQAQA